MKQSENKKSFTITNTNIIIKKGGIDILNAEIIKKIFLFQRKKEVVNDIRSIEFHNVTMQYAGCREPIIYNANFKISAGEKVVLLGEKGSGKSTIVNLILGLYRPTSGKILVNGKDIKKIDKVQLRRQMGIVLQDNILFNKSVLENIRMEHKEIGLEQVKEAAKLANIYEFIEHLPMKYETEITNLGMKLPKEKRDGIVLARAILKKKQFLIVDGVVEEIKKQEKEDIFKTFTNKACTYFLVLQHTFKSKEVDKVLIIKDRKVLETPNA